MSETTHRKRTVVWKDPTLNARAAEQMSGLEFLRAMQKGELPLPPICELVGFEPAEVEEGRVVFECTPAECHYNPIGTIHGGLACILFDSAMGCAGAHHAPCWCRVHHGRAQGQLPPSDHFAERAASVRGHYPRRSYFFSSCRRSFMSRRS